MQHEEVGKRLGHDVRVAQLALTLCLCACGADETPRQDSGVATPPTRDAALVHDASRPSVDSGGSDAAVPSEMPQSDASLAMPNEPPPRCEASEAAALPTGKDVFVANTGKRAVSSLTYTNVGAAGSYAEVVAGWSKATGCKPDSDGSLCKNTYKKPKAVSGPLAPFNEEMTLVFGGPIELIEIGIYQPESADWRRTAHWDRCHTDGLVFAGNKSWYECNGFVESYVSADGMKESDVPVQFAGPVAAGTEVHVMASALCSSRAADSECGYSSGLPLHGFAGDAAGSKLFAVTLRMPLGSTTPAYWILPSQVIRSSQYGCNCRGQGSDPVYKGGCGELDVAEILGGVTSSLEATTTLYSFQDITGGGSVTFARPVQEAVTFLVIFDAAGSQIAIRRLPADELDFEPRLPRERVTAWLADVGTARPLK